MGIHKLDCADEFGRCSRDWFPLFVGGSRALRVCGRHLRYGLTQTTCRKGDTK